MLAAFYAVIDIAGHAPLELPAVGRGNELDRRCTSWGSSYAAGISQRLKIHFGQEIFERTAERLHLGEVYVPIVEHALVLLAMWLVCLWLYRQRIFVRI